MLIFFACEAFNFYPLKIKMIENIIIIHFKNIIFNTLDLIQDEWYIRIIIMNQGLSYYRSLSLEN